MNKKILILLLAIFLAVVGFFIAKYLAGVLYYLANKTNPFPEVNLTTWGYYWDLYAHNVPAQKKKLQGALIAALFITFVLPALVIASLFNKKQSLHGDARFATTKEIQKSGLMGNKGILVGKYHNKYLMLGGQQFVLLAAPTRSGKGVAIVIPNLLNYSDSVVVLDLKLENFLLTSKFRAKNGQKVYLFSPFSEDLKSHKWNPFDTVSHDENFRVGEILAIGRSFYPVTGDAKTDFWNDNANNLFLGLALYLFETEDLPVTMGEVLRQSSGKGKPIQDHIRSIIDERAQSDKPLSDTCLDALNRFLSSPDNTLGNIISTFTSPLTIFANPIVDAATSSSDFKLEDVRRQRMSIYFGVQPNRLGDAKNLINLFYSLLIDVNLKTLPQQDSSLKYQCLVVNDEATAVGKVAKIADANSFIAGYNIRLLTIIQSIGQLEDVYKTQTRGLVTNHALQIVYPPREQRDANEYSEMLGYFTFKAKSKGQSRSMAWGQGGSNSENESDQRRALMLPQELKELSQDKEIIFMENTKPIMCEKAKYFNDSAFVDRLKSVSPSMKAIKGFPTHKQLEKIAFEDLELSIPIPDLDVKLHKAKIEKRITEITTVEQAEQIDISSLVIPEFKLDKTVFEDPENPQPEECLQVVDQFFGAVEWEEDTEAQNIVDDFFSQVEASDENPIENLVAVDEPEQTENLIAIDDTEFSHDEIENLVAVDEPDPLAMIAEMENLVAVDEPEQMENLVSADESDPLTMIAELENLEDSLFVLGVTKFSHDEAKQIVDTVFNCAESEFAVDEDQQDNLNAVNKGQNGSIENSDIDDVYQAFSDQVNSK
ncbi:type IV secretory system conjugative DNA transfer family protein (plasmid) [Acinetobacter lwoffii]|uniref:type IV secretory system conjugative DNA transfer family protein n=2 Tax=Acinetobacter TaxID=469 RepID=UPI001C23D8B0|nr:type IV secretory system conjugative DNA transfer family protein [Acinetobacter lwoffii]QXB87639.1 type IV secretory system conjugative DNA transfer family protein [Acinetobacter lwoffii]